MKPESRGILLIITSTLFFSLNTLMVKLISVHMGSFSISMIRFAVGIAAGLILLYSTGAGFRVRNWKMWVLRGVLGSAAMVLYFKTIEVNGIAWTALLVNMSSFFAALIGWVLFKQKTELTTLIGMGIAFAGISFVYLNNPTVSAAGTMLGLLVALIRGFTTHIIKITGSQNHPVTVYLAACMAGLLMYPASPVPWESISLPILLAAAAAGLIVFTAQVLMTAGLKTVSAIRNSLLLYLSIPISLLMGYLTGEELTLRFLGGSALIIGGILFEFFGKKILPAGLKTALKPGRK